MYGLITKTVTEIHMSAFPREDYIIFSSLDDALEYIEENPLEVDDLYITECVISNMLNTSLRKLEELLNSPLLIFDKVNIICSLENTIIKKIEFAKKSKETLSILEIVEIDFTISNIISLITKRQKERQKIYSRKSIVRKHKDEIDNNLVIDDNTKIVSEEEKLSNLQDLETKTFLNRNINKSEARLIQVTGLDESSYALLAFMLANSKMTKALIVETNFSLLPITYVSNMSENILEINIEDFLLSPTDVIERINNSIYRIIVLTGTNRLLQKNISAMQIVSIILAYINEEAIQDVIVTSTLDKAITGVETIVAIPNNVISIIKTATTKSSKFFKDAILIGVDTSAEPLAILNIKDFTSIIKDVFKRNEGVYEILTFREEGEYSALSSIIARQRNVNALNTF